MADAAPLLPGLPDEIAVWEILVRLPPKPLLRCRAVSPAWRRATSAPDFLLSHHARQPALPLLCKQSNVGDRVQKSSILSIDIVPFDHRAGVTAADRFRTVARLTNEENNLFLEASCDGLLLLCIDDFFPVGNKLCICNPATRQHAPLHQLDGFSALGLYPHPSTSTTGEGEYRLLLHRDKGIYVFTIGSGQPPRYIGYPDPDELDDCCGLLYHGSLHFYIHCDGDRIIVFDTTAETFRQIRAPVARDYAHLFEMGDMLGIFSLNDDETAVDIWVMQDYQAEVWDFKRRVELPIAKMNLPHNHEDVNVVLVHADDELFVLLGCDARLFQVDVNGKLVASFHNKGRTLTQYLLKQTLVQHTFFLALEGYVVNALPFI